MLVQSLSCLENDFINIKNINIYSILSSNYPLSPFENYLVKVNIFMCKSNRFPRIKSDPKIRKRNHIRHSFINLI